MECVITAIIISLIITVSIYFYTTKNSTVSDPSEERCRKYVNEKISVMNTKHSPVATTSLIELKKFNDKDEALAYVDEWETSGQTASVFSSMNAVEDIKSVSILPFYIGLLKFYSSSPYGGTDMFFLVCDSNGSVMPETAKLS